MVSVFGFRFSRGTSVRGARGGRGRSARCGSRGVKRSCAVCAVVEPSASFSRGDGFTPRSRDRSRTRGAGFRASQALRSERTTGSRRGTHLAVDLDRLEGRPRAILGLARARREVHRDEARVSVARTGAAWKEGEPRSALGTRSAAKKIAGIGLSASRYQERCVRRSSKIATVYVSGGNNCTTTSRARVDAARASDMRLANARLAALAVVLGIVAVAAQDDLDLDFDPTQQDVRSARVPEISLSFRNQSRCFRR